MKKSKFAIALFTLTLIIIALFGLNQNANANRILELEGDVKFKEKDNEFQLADLYEHLSYEDKLQIGADSSVVIRCRNTDKKTIIEPGRHSVSKICPPGELAEVIEDENDHRLRPPTADLSQTPYIISPRNSSIFPEEITIKWNPVSDANSYTVKIEDWEAKTTNTEIIYSGEPLAPGFYFVSVKADNGESSGDVGFIVIDEQQAQFIREEASKIKQEGLETEAEEFILAEFYQDNDLHMLAIEILENLVATGNETKNIYSLLADIYNKVGLESEAYEFNKQAMELENN